MKPYFNSLPTTTELAKLQNLFANLFCLVEIFTATACTANPRNEIFCHLAFLRKRRMSQVLFRGGLSLSRQNQFLWKSFLYIWFFIKIIKPTVFHVNVFSASSLAFVAVTVAIFNRTNVQSISIGFEFQSFWFNACSFDILRNRSC